MIDQYAVFGNPVAHSQSPFIHACFARQQQQSMHYVATQAEPESFAQQVDDFLQGQGKGLNITVPFKEVAWQLAEVKTPRAALAGAVNTLWRDDQGRICGDNTDGLGLVNDLTQNLGCSLQGASILLLGAGGAVRGVIQPLLEAGCSELIIANRTPEKAQQLARHFAQIADPAVRLHACGYADIPVKAFDVIINGTSASLQGDLPPLPEAIVGAHTLCYDMMYAATQTPFCRWATEQGAARAVDGLGMLVEQAAEAFFRWREQRPDTAPVIALLRQSLAQQ